MPQNTPPLNAGLLSAVQAAAYLGLKPQTLSDWRVSGKGPKYIKLGKLVKYRQSELDAFINANEHRHTADAAASGK